MSYNCARQPHLFLVLFLGWIALVSPTPAEAGSMVGLGAKCLDVEGGSTADGTPVVLWECNGGQNQQWQLAASGSSFRIRGIGDKCLRPANPGGDSPLSIGPCDGVEDLWRAGVGFPDSFAWIHLESGQCIDVEAGNAANGTPIILFACNGNSNQQWHFNDDVGSLFPPGSLVGLDGKCADVEGAGTADGTPVVLWDCEGSENQTWEIEGTGASARFRGLADKCLQPADSVAGSQLVIRPCEGANDRWQYTGSAPVLTTLMHVSSGLCMDVEDSSTQNGTPLILFPCHGQPNQIWSFEPETVNPSICYNTTRTLCLNGRRFKVEVEWEDFEGNLGDGRVLGFRSDDSGLFWFFDLNNWELLVKVLDGCRINDHFWVFSAATTNVKYTLKVTDTQTGVLQTYVNPLGQSADAVTDTEAFATCP